MDILQYVHPEQDRPLARERDGEHPLDAMSVLALLENSGGERPLARRAASDLLELLPRRGRTSNQKRRCLKALKQVWRRNRSAKWLADQARRFNLSGRAVTADDFMRMPGAGRVPRQQGRGKWKSWTPEAVQRAAFAKGSLRQVAASMKDGHSRSATGSRSPWQVACCRAACCKAILQGQAAKLQRLRDVSVHSKPHAFWITNTMFDETKLWYSVNGFGCREFSTLAVHSQVTWADDAGVHDEDVFQPPKAMVRYAAATQWSALQKDGPAGILHKPEETPRAKFHGIICSHDSHAVNRLIVKHLRVQLPEDHVMLPSYCNQHHVGRAAADVTTRLNLLAPVWTLTKTFADGDFHVHLLRCVDAVLDNEEDGLEVVDPATFVLPPGDLREDFTQSLLARCRVGEQAAKATALTSEFASFFPYGWNRRRPLHPCPAGCCGPSACHDRDVSVGKACELVRKVILRRVAQPAKNKWTKLDPAFRQVALVVQFFSLVQSALEAKVGMTYADVLHAAATVMDQDSDSENEDGGHKYKGRLQKYGKRSLLFVGDPDSKQHLLLWLAVGEPIMVIHYRFFHRYTWYSHSLDKCPVLEFCPGSPEHRNPVAPALASLANMLFEPNGAGKVSLGPLRARYGAPILWPEAVLSEFQVSVVLAFSKLWRCLVHGFRQLPWSLGPLFDIAQSLERRQAMAMEFWNKPPCCLDDYVGRPLRYELCAEPTDLLEDDLVQFMSCMFTRCVPASTFVERVFAHLSTHTRTTCGKDSLDGLAAAHVTTVFDQAVQRWWDTLPNASKRALCRPFGGLSGARGSHTCAWHVFVHEHPPPPGSSKAERQAHISQLQREFKELPLARRRECKAAARLIRNQALQEEAQGDQADCAGGPWNLSASCAGRPYEWPLSNRVVRSTLEHGTPRQLRQSWANEHNRLIVEDPDFPKTVHGHEPCLEGECMAEFSEEQQALVKHLLTWLRLICLFHAAAKKRSLPCLAFEAGPLAVYAMVGAHTKSHPFKCEVLSLEWSGPPAALGQFELAIAKDPEPHLGASWPKITSEHAFVLQLLELSFGPWQIFLLDAAVEQTWTVMVVGKTLMDLGELRELEAKRLERLHAFRLWRKARQAKSGAVARVKYARRKGKPGKGKGKGEVPAGADSSTDEAEAYADAAPPPVVDGIVPEARPDAEVAPPPVADGVAPEAGPVGEAAPPPVADGVAPDRNKRGVAWGNGDWHLAEIYSKGRLVGCGATCKGHLTPGSDTVCKKSVTIGTSGLTREDLMLRLKRWLVAGLDDVDWDTDDPRAEHIAMGGRHMQDFADGLSEAVCDRIANGGHEA